MLLTNDVYPFIHCIIYLFFEKQLLKLNYMPYFMPDNQFLIKEEEKRQAILPIVHTFNRLLNSL